MERGSRLIEKIDNKKLKFEIVRKHNQNLYPFSGQIENKRGIL